MRYFDAHCHIQFDAYDTDRGELMASMREQEVGGLVVGVDLATSAKALALVQDSPSLFASVGLHPNDVLLESFDEAAFRALLADPKVVALGECGLDNFRPEDVGAIQGKQREVFERHVRLAIEYGKPLMIHARPTKGTMDAYQDLIGILARYKKEFGDKLWGDIHFFVGGVEEARQLIELDFTLSYTAVLTFARDYDEVVRFAPATHLITETDSPFIAPAPNRGGRNDPRAVKAVLKAMAEIRGEDEEKLGRQVLENVSRVFRIAVS